MQALLKEDMYDDETGAYKRHHHEDVVQETRPAQDTATLLRVLLAKQGVLRSFDQESRAELVRFS